MTEEEKRNYTKEYYEKNKLKIKERVSKNYFKNRDKIREYNKNYYQQNNEDKEINNNLSEFEKQVLNLSEQVNIPYHKIMLLVKHLKLKTIKQVEKYYKRN